MREEFLFLCPSTSHPSKISDFVKAKQVISKICQCAHWYILEISLDKPVARYAARVFSSILKESNRVLENTCYLSEPPSVRTGLFSLEWRRARAAQKRNRYAQIVPAQRGWKVRTPLNKYIMPRKESQL